ncbi:peptidoglycan DD-metalloendopeptidase family protein [Alloiococcus sp. CFN-8]|uniref:peptidoglycan DD-metalloendopeptidase family protein n=1 Tax=Alloiococcus sp. CFN-8 TaxID=3416081 RepID=UPI003CE6F608
MENYHRCKDKLKKSFMLILALVIPFLFVNLDFFVEGSDSTFTRGKDYGYHQVKEIKLFSSNTSIEYKVNNSPSEERESLLYKFFTLFNAKINGISLVVQGVPQATVLNNEEAERLLNNIKAYYVNKLPLSGNSVESIEIKEDIYFEQVECHPWEIDTMELALNNLIELAEMEKLNIQTTLKKSYNEAIAPKVVIQNSEELNYGEEKSQQGEEGLKEVEKKLIYNNDSLIYEEIINENIVKEAKDTLITKGMKISEDNLAQVIAIPSRGSISSNYGVRWGRLHKGTDFAADIGDPIIAALTGTVKEAGFEDGYGYMVLIDHGEGIETLYGHCSELKVKAGDRVEKGQVIALVGNTGRSTGPHLHFEVRVNGEAKDSLNYLPLKSLQPNN